MARIRVFSPSANPSIDQPTRLCSKNHAALLIRRNAADKIGSLAIQLRPLLPNPENTSGTLAKERRAKGYDRAVRRGSASTFHQVYEMRDSAGVDMWQYVGNQQRQRTPVRVANQ